VIRISLITLIAFVAALLGSSCSSQPTCSTGLHPYKDKCLTNMAIQYVGCTFCLGNTPTTEISADVGGTLKVVADASLKLAYKRTEQENTPVALEIVRDCMEIAKTNSPPDDGEQQAATGYQQQFDEAERQWQQKQVDTTPTIKVSASTARRGEQLTVTGTRFWPDEIINISVHATLVAQAQADKDGAFSTVVTVPADAPTSGVRYHDHSDGSDFGKVSRGSLCYGAVRVLRRAISRMVRRGGLPPRAHLPTR